MIEKYTPGLVSVIIPTWNRGILLIEAINSILAQSYQYFEILVCDDGSTDNSKSLVLNINDDRIKWIDGGHTGSPAKARNRGLDYSSGEWIAFLDSDDVWFSEKLDIQLKALEQERGYKCGSSICISNAFRYKPEYPQESSVFFLTEEDQRISLSNMLTGNKFITSSTLVHRNVLLKSGGFPESELLNGYEDYSLWLKLIFLSPAIYLNKPLVMYRDDPNQSIRSRFKNNVCLKKTIVMIYCFWWEFMRIIKLFIK